MARRYRFKQSSESDLHTMRGIDARTLLRQLDVARWKLPLIARHMRRLMTRDIAEIALFPGIAAALNGLHEAGVRLAIVSSNSLENVRLVLGAETAALIDHFACGTSLFEKPAKFRRVLKRARIYPRGRDRDRRRGPRHQCGRRLRDRVRRRRMGLRGAKRPARTRSDDPV